MMAAAANALVDIQGLVKDYGALRPVRIASLNVQPGDRIALMGLDQQAAEMFVTLVTGAALPDEGSIRLFGQATSEIPDADRWLQLLDRLGIMSDRAVLVEQYSAAQNIAMPFTLELEPIAPDVRPRVGALALEVGLDEATLEAPVARATPLVQARVRLARAVALEPTLLLAEHPSASLPRDEVAAFARDLARVAAARGIGVVAISADRDFIRAFDGTPLIVEPATGRVRKQSFWEKLR
jgi:predicted ABC-type transport system involved in lysophospholipase L1 biosynthesis ATPase subunit